jgi:hypothetical protein
MFFKFEEYIKAIKIPAGLMQLIPVAGFFIMFSIPFITGKFIEDSRYSPILEDYVRYTGILIIPAIGGLTYIMFKRNKSFGEWFLLLSVIMLTMLVYEQTYMKMFLPMLLVPFIGIGLINTYRLKKKYSLTIISIFMLISLSFSGFYQYLHFLPSHGLDERYIEDSTYTSGRWMKEYATSSAISNDMVFGNRIAAASETVHYLTPIAIMDFTYRLVTINLSYYNEYPITSEEFWFNVGRKMSRDVGEDSWDNLHMLYANTSDFNITYFAENTRAEGNVIWHHGKYPSKLLNKAYNESYLVYDVGNVRVWDLE